MRIMGFIMVFFSGLCIGIQWGLNKKHIKAEIKRQRRLALETARRAATEFRMRWEDKKNKESLTVNLLSCRNPRMTYKGNCDCMTDKEFAEALRKSIKIV